jgi:hypothetical protein
VALGAPPPIGVAIGAHLARVTDHAWVAAQAAAVTPALTNATDAAALLKLGIGRTERLLSALSRPPTPSAASTTAGAAAAVAVAPGQQSAAVAPAPAAKEPLQRQRAAMQEALALAETHALLAAQAQRAAGYGSTSLMRSGSGGLTRSGSGGAGVIGGGEEAELPPLPLLLGRDGVRAVAEALALRGNVEGLGLLLARHGDAVAAAGRLRALALLPETLDPKRSVQEQQQTSGAAC